MASWCLMGWLFGIAEVGAALVGGDAPREPLNLAQVAARAAVVYLVGLAVVRVGKSRMIGRTTAVDVLLGFILGSLLSRGITGHASISGTAMASATLIAVHWGVTGVACRSHWLGDLLKGHAALVIDQGTMNRDHMLHSHISDHDLIEQLRLHGIEDVSKVLRAYKERNGEISVIPRPPEPRVLEVAVAEGVQTVRIEISK